MDGLTQAENRELEQRLQKRQVKEFMSVRPFPRPSPFPLFYLLSSLFPSPTHPST
ncbi:hypothetical protein GE09DRAFT_1117199 [Coniochaeta sp. 2T2.1]|nr:hypothetical protein GE09DRAFT_1117199 [Coniochaeta sp. 2T2.1]